MAASGAEERKCVCEDPNERLHVPRKCGPKEEEGDILALQMENFLEKERRGKLCEDAALRERRGKRADAHHDRVRPQAHGRGWGRGWRRSGSARRGRFFSLHL